MINQDDFEILDPLPNPPNIWAEIRLFFDCDLPIEPLSDIIHLPAADARCRLNTRINPITHTRNAGYWFYHTSKECTFEDGVIVKQLYDALTEHQAEFEEAMHQYSPSQMHIVIYVEIDEINAFSGIHLWPEFIERLNFFHACVDLVVEEKPSL